MQVIPSKHKKINTFECICVSNRCVKVRHLGVFGTFYIVSFFTLFSLIDPIILLTKSRDGVFHTFKLILKQTLSFLKRWSFCSYNSRRNLIYFDEDNDFTSWKNILFNFSETLKKSCMKILKLLQLRATLLSFKHII